MSAEYVCRLGTPTGQVVREVRQAEDEASLRRELAGAGYHVFELKPKSVLGRVKLRGAGDAQRRVPMRPFLVFNQELAGLLKAGLPLLQGLDLLYERVGDPSLRRALGDIRDRVRAGEELSEAVTRQGETFPALYSATLKAGERTGELEEVLRRFIRYQKLVALARKKIVSAMVYPAVLVGLSIALIAVLAIFVVPQFRGFYDAMGADLPGLTRFTLTVSEKIAGIWPVLLVLSAVIAFAAWRFKSTRRARAIRATVVLRLPLLGGVFKRLAVAEFCRSAATLLLGGMPLPQTLTIGVGSVGNLRIRERLEPVVGEVQQGQALYEALERSDVFDALAVDMVKVGESTGSLGTMLAEVADFLDEEVETRLERILGVIEPLMLIFMGLIIALILVSIYLPLFSVLQQIQ